MVGKIGVLALQGAFDKHSRMLHKLNVPSLEVRYANDLQECKALILPGGESTTMTKQIKENGLLEPLRHFASTKPLFGTCAGLILMSKQGILPLFDIEVERNAYGAQAHSFSTSLKINFLPNTFEAIFIRAPRISTLEEQVQIHARIGPEAVFIQQGRHMGCCFHPELTEDPSIHHFFLQQL